MRCNNYNENNVRHYFNDNSGGMSRFLDYRVLNSLSQFSKSSFQEDKEFVEKLLMIVSRQYMDSQIYDNWVDFARTAWKVSKYGFFSGPYFPACGVSLRIQSECRKIRTKKNFVFGHFSRSVGNCIDSFSRIYIDAFLILICRVFLLIRYS